MKIITGFKKIFLFLILLILIHLSPHAQNTTIVDSSEAGYRTVIAGKEYDVPALRRFLWGGNYRELWTTPIRVPVLNIDSIHGGLTPVELGGGRQTKTLHVKDAKGKRWVLRSVNKTYTGALPPIARGTIVESIANDQIATNHPFAAITVPPMATAAGVYHARPELYLVLPGKSLGEYNDIFANMLVWLEERPDDTHSDKENFGNPKDIDGSTKMVENITDDNDFRIDQYHYVKTRLFDMFIGDWGRHIDNWRWAQFDSGKYDVYRAVPKDRDQTQARFEGVLFNIIKTVAGLRQLQSFDEEINDITWYNFPAMEIDRRFTNELTRQVWIDSAKALQTYLTDGVIESGVRQLPPEIFALNGEKTIGYLKQRRNDLIKYADSYYDFISDVVEIPGTKKHEFFNVQRLNDEQTLVTVYKIKKEGDIRDTIYKRLFENKETKEVRLYGIDGNDIFHVDGEVNDGITIRVIGGTGRDSIYDASRVSGRTHKTKFYDNPGSVIMASPETKIRIADTTFVYPFDERFKYDKIGKIIYPGLNTFYRIFIGIGYRKRIHGWREQPFKYEQRFGLNYSISENSFHPYYEGTHPQLFSAWNLRYTAGFDGIRRFNYFGPGNETLPVSRSEDFHWLRTRNFYANAGIDRTFAKHHIFGVQFDYDGLKVIDEATRFVNKSNPVIDNSTFNYKHFGGATAAYAFSKLNDPVVPTKGMNFSLASSYTYNLKETHRSFTNLASRFELYIPLGGNFCYYLNTGGATLWGTPEFYQYNHIGGGVTVRGFLRNRFYGKSSFYNQNEIRWISDVKSYLFNGKAGLIGLFDIGRVWLPGENSNKWHKGIGGGLLISPFNKVSATVYYTVSEEDRRFNFRIGRFF